MAAAIWDYVIVIIMADPRELSKLRKRSGVVKGSIIYIDTRLGTLRDDADHPDIRDSTRQMLAKLKEHDAEFRKIHLTLIDLIDKADEETLLTEEATLDEHDNLVALLTVRIMKFADSAFRASSTSTISERDVLMRRCDRLKTRLTATDTVLSSLTREDTCQLEQHHEQLFDFKKEMSEINNRLLSLTLGGSDNLPDIITDLEKKLSDCSLCNKELSHSSTTPTAAAVTGHSDPKGVKLPKTRCPNLQWEHNSLD